MAMRGCKLGITVMFRVKICAAKQSGRLSEGLAARGTSQPERDRHPRFGQSLADMWYYLIFGVKKNTDHCCNCLAPTVNPCYEATETFVP